MFFFVILLRRKFIVPLFHCGKTLVFSCSIASACLNALTDEKQSVQSESSVILAEDIFNKSKSLSRSSRKMSADKCMDSLPSFQVFLPTFRYLSGSLAIFMLSFCVVLPSFFSVFLGLFAIFLILFWVFLPSCCHTSWSLCRLFFILPGLFTIFHLSGSFSSLKVFFLPSVYVRFCCAQ